MLGAKVIGISDRIPTNPSNFEASNISQIVDDRRINLIDRRVLEDAVVTTKPDFIFHLAAQALVNKSYQDPIETLQTNIMGTANLLESLRKLKNKCVAVMITSDKCYDNVEWEWGYRENDRLGGKDPYSASKGGAELVIHTYFESFLKNTSIRLGIARAGNVIGGGDWAHDRLVPDCIRAWSENEVVEIKNPATTRPWQLVLEPLGGYLSLAVSLDMRKELSGEAFNFGPLSENNFTVDQLITEMQKHWTNVKWKDASAESGKVYEASLLKLNCDKALHRLNWRPTYNFSDTVRATMEWYKAFYQGSENMQVLCQQHIKDYCDVSRNKGIEWAL
jgi:CDP-glucose 4,6-dehydratase